MSEMQWRRINNEPFEYAIEQGQHGDEFVKLADDSCLRRPVIYTIDDYAKQILQPRFNACKVAEDLMRKDQLTDALFMGLKPLTKWQRMKLRLMDIKQRCKDIWTIVSGGDVHRDCGY